MIEIPTEDQIRGMDPASAVALANSLLFTGGVTDLAALRDLLLTARRALEREEVDQILLDEAIGLYEVVGLSSEQDSADPLVYLSAVLNYWGDTLPA